MTVYWRQSNVCSFPPYHHICSRHRRCHLVYHAVLMWASRVWCIALTLNTDKSVLTVSQPDSQSVCIQRVACRPRAAAAALLWAAGWEGSHLVNIGAVSVKLQSTELGLWPGDDSFLTASVCVCDIRGRDREWSYTGCAARSLTRFILVSMCMYSFINVSDKPQQPDMDKNRKVKTTKS